MTVSCVIYTFVTPSGTGSNTFLWSSLGICEWSGKALYIGPPYRINRCMSFTNQSTEMIIVPKEYSFKSHALFTSSSSTHF